MGSGFLGLDAAAAVLEASGQAVISFGPEGMERVNQAGLELLGIPRGALLGLAPWKMIEPRPSPSLEQGVSNLSGRLTVGPKAGRIINGRIRSHGDGKQTWVFSLSNRPVGAESMAADWVQTLAGPLSVIRASAEMAGRQDLGCGQNGGGAPPVNRALEEIISQVDRISASAGDLLAKLWGEAEGRPRELDLNQIIRSEVAVLKGHHMFTPDIDLTMDLSPNLPVIRGLYPDFSHSMRQLILNALEALTDCPEKRLALTTRLKDRWIVIGVTDTGCGIRPEILDRVFEPFTTTRAETRPAAGLGLNSVRQLLQPYQAQLKVASKPGLTSFSILLDLRQVADEKKQ